jgi:hypothetical protein
LLVRDLCEIALGAARLAAQLKATTNASYGWLAQTLRMGKPGSVSTYVSQVRQDKAGVEVQRLIRILED